MKLYRNGKFRIKLLLIATIFLIVAFALIFGFHLDTERYVSWSPNYEKIDLTPLENKLDLSEEDYGLIYMQTGLGKSATDEILKRGDSFSIYQEDFFRKPNYVCEKIGIITYEERNVNQYGNKDSAFSIPDIKEGDVLITKNTHSLGWRHGHSGIVVDSEARESLEAVLWGEDSVVQNVDKWQGYPNFVLLRPKKGISGEEVAKYVREKMDGITYGLLTGIPRKAPEIIAKTQCAHLVWYPYFKEGYDVDADGGWLVTPDDLMKSPFFNVVQVYGVNPKELWK